MVEGDEQDLAGNRLGERGEGEEAVLVEDYAPSVMPLRLNEVTEETDAGCTKMTACPLDAASDGLRHSRQTDDLGVWMRQGGSGFGAPVLEGDHVSDVASRHESR